MKSGFVRVPGATAEPDPPEPVPAIPIKIIPGDTLPPPPGPGDLDLPLPPPKQRTDDFYKAWDRFLAIEPKRAKTTSRAAQKVEEEKQAIKNGETADEGLKTQENAAKSWEQAASECRAKVAAIVDECQRLNQKYRDAIFDLEANQYCLQSLGGAYPKAVDNIDPPPWIKRIEDIFDDPQFYIDDATATDVHQGNSGDCWFLAALMAVSAKKELIERLCVARDEKVGVYGFVFYRDGEWIYEVIDDKLFLRVGDDDHLEVVRDWDRDAKEGWRIKYDDEKLKEALQKGGLALYFSHCKSNETWLPLIEKAYAKAHGDYYAIEGGFASEGIEDLTGGVAVILNPEDIMDKDRFWREQLSRVNEKYLFGGGSKPTGTKGFIGGHAYAVLDKYEDPDSDLKLLKLRNPWGETEWDGDWSDGSKLWTAAMMTKLNHTFGDDGIFWISYKDFLKHFPSINRVRLFDDTWTVSQQWTCVNAPWTVDYLDTKFQITISEAGPVVVVLAQPDDRYYYGLRGRMLYSLHFRIYRVDEEERWIVRSMHNSGAETLFTRSVSAEIDDLEPGTYDVVVKVTATRSTTGMTAEEAIMKYAVSRKEKLLNVGRRFDYAQSKGNLKAMEKQNRQRRRDQQREMDLFLLTKNRRLNQQDRERAKKRKARLAEALNAQMKEFHAKSSKKMKARRERRKARKDAQAALRKESVTNAETSEGKAEQLTPPEPSQPVSEPPNEHDYAQPPKEPNHADDAEGGTETARQQSDAKEHTEGIAEKLSGLDIRDRKPPRDFQRPGSPFRPTVGESSESEWDSPIEPPDDLADDDFDWDPEIDGPVFSGVGSETDSLPPLSPAGRRRLRSKKDIFAEDP
ncbi:hypothetical protein CERZMDRAFT_72258 [Cercospora zeae-maydis SCOH1-5]|uniref:Calpain catalytic domain-containing protein n=1 Tax=Cercospora zeae-maydis SCOH1-5 TaxID=717836 RepID=A0A6A6EZE5_9PEZI|nr:hypothetical protein CERZMDRAFT_72258 [Cercospora zeae-maydis SCOH1-5]